MSFDLERAKKIVNEQAIKLGLEIVSVKLVHENGMRILRIIADKEFGLNLDDSERLNKLINDALDQEDVSEDEYYLEVSSVGAERELKTERELNHAIGRYVSVKLGHGVFLGDLVEINDEGVILRVNDKGRFKNELFKHSAILEIRLAVKF